MSQTSPQTLLEIIGFGSKDDAFRAIEDADLNDIDAKDGWGRTPLLHTLATGRTEMATRLINKGADIHIKSPTNISALHMAAGAGDQQMMSLLIQRGANINEPGDMGATPLHEAVAHGGTNAVEMLINAGADTTLRDGRNRTLLDYAITWSKSAVVQLLIDRGFDPNAEDAYGNRPLMSAIRTPPAIRTSAKKVIETLIANGADIAVPDKSGNTPLHAAVMAFGDGDVVELLLQAGADPNAQNQHGRTPLHAAIEVIKSPSGDMLRHPAAVLLLHGADLHIQDDWGCSPRLNAIVFCSSALFDFISSRQLFNELQDDLGNAIVTDRPRLIQAKRDVHDKYAQTIRVLLSHGVSPDTFRPLLDYIYDNKIATPMLKSDRSQILSMLLDAKLDPTTATGNNATLLHAACLDASSKDIKCILANGGADAVNLRDRQNDTPLHIYLADHQKPSVAGLDSLIKAGADVTLKNGLGQNVVQILESRADGPLSDNDKKTLSGLLQDYLRPARNDAQASGLAAQPG